MKPIYSSILCPFFFAVLCEAYPATAPYFDYHSMDRPSFAKDSIRRAIHEMVNIDDSRAHDEQKEFDLSEDLRRLFNSAEDQEVDDLVEDLDDHRNSDKRATSKIRQPRILFGSAVNMFKQHEHPIDTADVIIRVDIHLERPWDDFSQTLR